MPSHTILTCESLDPWVESVTLGLSSQACEALIELALALCYTTLVKVDSVAASLQMPLASRHFSICEDNMKSGLFQWLRSSGSTQGKAP